MSRNGWIATIVAVLALPLLATVVWGVSTVTGGSLGWWNAVLWVGIAYGTILLISLMVAGVVAAWMIGYQFIAVRRVATPGGNQPQGGAQPTQQRGLGIWFVWFLRKLAGPFVVVFWVLWLIVTFIWGYKLLISHEPTLSPLIIIAVWVALVLLAWFAAVIAGPWPQPAAVASSAAGAAQPANAQAQPAQGPPSAMIAAAIVIVVIVGIAAFFIIDMLRPEFMVGTGYRPEEIKADYHLGQGTDGSVASYEDLEPEINWDEEPPLAVGERSEDRIAARRAELAAHSRPSDAVDTRTPGHHTLEIPDGGLQPDGRALDLKLGGIRPDEKIVGLATQPKMTFPDHTPEPDQKPTITVSVGGWSDRSGVVDPPRKMTRRYFQYRRHYPDQNIVAFGLYMQIDGKGKKYYLGDKGWTITRRKKWYSRGSKSVVVSLNTPRNVPAYEDLQGNRVVLEYVYLNPPSVD